MTASKAKPKAKPAAKSIPKAGPLGDWRAETLAEVRRLIHDADPDIVEEIKWVKPSNPAGVPVFSHGGIVCTGETYKEVVKLTFAKGASLEDPKGLFNSSLEGNTRRAIDIREGEAIDAKALKALIKAAVAENLKAGTPVSRDAKSSKRSAATTKSKAVKLLSGGNPQIAKADGDEPVRAYIASMPGWKQDVGRRLDELITRTVPNVRKAMRWNTPFYGIQGQGWFLGFHCITKYVKVAFFRGASLRPVPPEASKQEHVRYFHIHEDDALDEELLARWIRQASELPGEKVF